MDQQREEKSTVRNRLDTIQGGNILQLKIGRHLKITEGKEGTEEAINEISVEGFKKGSPEEGIS